MARRWVGLALVMGAIALAASAPARADYVVKTCDGNPAAPWVNGYVVGATWASFPDSCASPGGSQSFNLASATLPYLGAAGAGFVIPGALTLAHVTMSFHSQSVASGGGAILQVGYQQSDGSTPKLLSSPIGDASAGTTVDDAIPNGAGFYFDVYCSGTTNTSCSFASPLGIVVVDSGNGLSGTVSGTQSLAYTASDGGSGVAAVSVSLGGTVIATSTSACQDYNLQPCPAAANGTLSINTAAVPNGTYPVVLTATDESGDTTTAQAGTVTVANQVPSSTTTVTPPKTPVSSEQEGNAKVILSWHYHAHTTTAKRLVVKRFARGEKLTITCKGKGCPIHRLTATAKTLSKLRKKIIGRRFPVGDHVIVTVSRKGYLPARGEAVIQANTAPLSKQL
jgi:hypothetical protein